MLAHFKFKNNNNYNNKRLIPGEMNGAKGQHEIGGAGKPHRDPVWSLNEILQELYLSPEGFVTQQ